MYLRDRTVTLAQVERSCYDDPALRQFAVERVEVIHDPKLIGGQAIADVTTQDGKTVTARCNHPLGTPENPLSRDQVEDKFRTYAVSRLSPDTAESVIAAIDKLETLSSARELIDLLRQPNKE